MLTKSSLICKYLVDTLQRLVHELSLKKDLLLSLKFCSVCIIFFSRHFLFSFWLFFLSDWSRLCLVNDQNLSYVKNWKERARAHTPCQKMEGEWVCIQYRYIYTLTSKKCKESTHAHAGRTHKQILSENTHTHTHYFKKWKKSIHTIGYIYTHIYLCQKNGRRMYTHMYTLKKLILNLWFLPKRYAVFM